MSFYSNETARRVKRENRARERRDSLAKPFLAASLVAHIERVEPKAPALREPKLFVATDWVWWAVRCAPGMALRVADEVCAQGLQGFAPAGRRVEVVRFRKRKTARRIKEFPVFGAYAFIGAPPGVGVFQRTHLKIEEVLGDGVQPLPVPARAIAALSALDHAGRWGSRLTPASRIGPSFAAGDIVWVTDGAFAGFQGVVKAMPREMRVVVEMSLFGRETEIEIGACQVARASV